MAKFLHGLQGQPQLCTHTLLSWKPASQWIVSGWPVHRTCLGISGRGVSFRAGGRWAFQIQPSLVASFICAAKQRSTLDRKVSYHGHNKSMAGNLEGWNLTAAAGRARTAVRLSLNLGWAQPWGLMSSIAGLPSNLPASLRHFQIARFRFPISGPCNDRSRQRWDDGGPAKPGNIFVPFFFHACCWLTRQRQRQQERLNDRVAESRSRSPTLCTTGRTKNGNRLDKRWKEMRWPGSRAKTPLGSLAHSSNGVCYRNGPVQTETCFQHHCFSASTHRKPVSAPPSPGPPCATDRRPWQRHPLPSPERGGPGLGRSALNITMTSPWDAVDVIRSQVQDVLVSVRFKRFPHPPLHTTTACPYQVVRPDRKPHLPATASCHRNHSTVAVLCNTSSNHAEATRDPTRWWFPVCCVLVRS